MAYRFRGMEQTSHPAEYIFLVGRVGDALSPELKIVGKGAPTSHKTQNQKQRNPKR